MIRLLTDENIKGAVVQALLQHTLVIDVVRVQDMDLYSALDPAILEWASENNRIVLTHDAKTMIPLAHERVHKGLSMPGMIIFSQSLSVNVVVDDLLDMALYGLEGEWENRVVYLPLP